MVEAYAPLLIVGTFLIVVIFGMVAVWEQISNLFMPITERYRVRLERAGIAASPERILLSITIVGLILWVVAMLVLKPSFLFAILLVPIAFLLAFKGYGIHVGRMISGRLRRFCNQLELVLRWLAGSVRVGLSLRQGLAMMIDELEEPGRTEFARVIQMTDIGLSPYDALDRLAERMPSTEMSLMVRAIRIQAQTGGNLPRILDQLAETIKSRRRIDRKIVSITSESRMSAYVVAALPIVVGGAVVVINQTTRETMLFTFLGHVLLVIVAILEGIGVFILRKMVMFKV